MADQLELALAHNDAGNLQPLSAFSPPLFAMYRGEDTQLLMRWHDYQRRELDGDRRQTRQGRPWCEVVFPKFTQDENAYFNGTLCSGEEDALVTVRLLNKTTNTWTNYNATMDKPEPLRDYNDDYKRFKEVRVVFRDLEELA